MSECKRWDVIQVKNGYVIRENTNQPGEREDTYVAGNIPELMNLIGDLAAGRPPVLFPEDDTE